MSVITTSGSSIKKCGAALLCGIYTACSAFSASAAISQDPLILVTSADPNILINLSVEVPMGGAAYNDQNDGGSCGGRVNDGGTVGICYFPAREYLGYFDPDKCYEYTGSGANGYFKPTGAATSHECSEKFSGNFMNWATMTAMDAFINAMTGGNRVLVGGATSETTAETIIERAKRTHKNSWFQHKLISSVSSVNNVAPSTVTPWSDSKIHIYNEANGWTVSFGTEHESQKGEDYRNRGTYNVRVKVCDAGQGLEENCTKYQSGGTTYYKPEGLIQKNAENKRFAVTSYLNNSTIQKNGGVLRAKMKYVGPDKPKSNGFGAREANPQKEFGVDGLLIQDPDGQSGTNGITDSGVINYINKFSREHGYKSYDPVSELFYESLHYFRGQGITNPGPTSEFLPTTDDEYGHFPAYATWDDPIQYRCQKNFIVGINDAFPHRDKHVPGTHFTCGLDPNPGSGGEGLYEEDDCDAPADADTFFNAKTWTNKIGGLEKQSDGTAGVEGIGTQLGESLAWQSGANPPAQNGRKNVYYVAGFAFHANTTDIRPDLTGDQTIRTFMIDTQEFKNNPLVGNINPLWLTGKYGGFIDQDGDGTPNLKTEWDADDDNVPDNYVLATDPQKMVHALEKSFAEIDKRSASSSAVVANSARLQNNTHIYQARYDSDEWSGDLLSILLNADGTIPFTTAADGTIKITFDWNAQAKLDNQDWNNGRNIFSYTPPVKDAAGNVIQAKGIPFTWSALSTAQQNALHINPISGSSDSKGGKRLEFIRGNHADEHTSKDDDKPFRDRQQHKLGDLVNSAPVYVAGPGFRYPDHLEGADCGSNSPSTCYSAFAAGNASRTPMIYVGGNDGMLHGFRDDAGSEDQGEELVAYVPNFLIPQLNQLTSQKYTHRFYVDGSPTAGDAFFKSGSGSDAWHTILVGGARAGGKGYYALDITDPTKFTQNDINASNLALWEFTHADLGYTYSQPAIVKMANGEWAVIIGNGYENSGTGQAYLFVLFIEAGIDGWTSGDFVKISTDAVTLATGKPNGLGTPAPVDTDGDSIVDTVYAGDLYGNLWKFDVSDEDETEWTNATSRLKLFTATDDESPAKPQPITVRPEVGNHPTGGTMVYFGTGKFFEVGDNNPATYGQQAFYAIRDEGALVAKGDLVEQKIVATQTKSGSEFRATTNKTIDWSTKDGWYMDLTDPGELVAVDPLLNHGMIIFITQVPSTHPCDPGGYSWLMEVDAITGGWPAKPNLDVVVDGKIDGLDVLDTITADFGSGSVAEQPKPTGKKSAEGILAKPTIITHGKKEYKYSSGSSGGIERTVEAGDESKGRQSWEQIR